MLIKRMFMRNFIALCFLCLSMQVFAQSDVKVIHLDDESFKEKVFDFENEKEWKFKGDKPVLIDFYASWCGPCKRVAPILDELQAEYGESIQIYKVNTEKARKVSSAFGVRSIPYFLFIPTKGKPSAANGALPKETFIKAIKDVLKVNHPTK